MKRKKCQQSHLVIYQHFQFIPFFQCEQIWSNGRYKSVEHRAMTNKNKRRTSHATFVFPRDDVEVEPFDHMIDAQNPMMYQKVLYGDYLRQSMKRKMEGKTHTDVAKIKA